MADDPFGGELDWFEALGEGAGGRRRPPADPDKPVKDGMHPPTVPQLVHCIHCGEEFDSWRIEWRVEDSGRGFWACPIPGCDGAGFRLDIYPVDVGNDGHWTDPDGRELYWVEDDGDEEEGEDISGDQGMPRA